MTLLERIEWIKKNMKVPKLVISGAEFNQVAEAIKRKENTLGSNTRYIIMSESGNVAYKEGSAIYTAPFGQCYLTSKLLTYKEVKAAQKAIDKSCALVGCKVVPVSVHYEVKR